jgi:hypothetical protein
VCTNPVSSQSKELKAPRRDCSPVMARVSAIRTSRRRNPIVKPSHDGIEHDPKQSVHEDREIIERE